MQHNLIQTVERAPRKAAARSLTYCVKCHEIRMADMLIRRLTSRSMA